MSMGGGVSGSNGNNQSTAVSGFSQLPPQLQQAFEQYGTTLNNQTADPNALTSAFTPQTLNAGATSALSALSNDAYSPTAANISSNLSSVTNPFMQDVINPTEQAAYGADSALASNAASA